MRRRKEFNFVNFRALFGILIAHFSTCAEIPVLINNTSVDLCVRDDKDTGGNYYRGSGTLRNNIIYLHVLFMPVGHRLRRRRTGRIFSRSRNAIFHP